MASSTTPQADVGEEEFEQKCSLLETNSEDANSMVMVMYDRHDETKRSPRAMLPGPRLGNYWKLHFDEMLVIIRFT